MAQTVHLTLEIDGNAVGGESTIASLDRAGTIECSSFSWGVEAPYEPGSLVLTGRRLHEQVTITKRIDKSTPLLIKAVCMNEPVTSAEFRFFRPSTSGAGAEEHFYTVLLEKGAVASVNQISEDPMIGGVDAPPMMEEVSFVFNDITWTYVNGPTHTDSIR